MRFHTAEFPTAPEGDLDLCNGAPGSALAAWLRAVLAAAGISAHDPLQEDYGWGFWLEHPAHIWVAVSYAGDTVDAGGEWFVSVVHEFPFFAPRQWFRQQEGRALEAQAFAAIQAALAAREGVVGLTLEDG
jgi:hypothetical protein